MPVDAGGPGNGAHRRSEAVGSTLDLPSFVEWLARDRSWPHKILWLAGGLIVATLLTYLRLQIGLGSAGIPIAFYFPAIIVVTLTAGWEFGLSALLLSLLLVWFVFIPPPFSLEAPTRGQFITLAIWALVSATLIMLGYFLRLSLQQLLRSEARYRKLVGLASDIVWLTDAQGNVHAPHRAWSRITGMEWPDYAGRKWLKAVREEDHSVIDPARTGSRDFHQAEFQVWDKSANDWRWYRARAVGLAGPDGVVEEWLTAMRDIHDAKLARERADMMLGESRHRLKNLVTIIEALAKSSRGSARADAESEAFLKRFLGRLRALGAAADLALAGNNKIMELGEAVRATLAPFMEGNSQFHITGPELILSQETGGSLALALHELATNAIKYGALSTPEGNVVITWSASPVPEGQKIVLTWKENGGPAPQQPEKDGFGQRVIRSAASREREGHVALEYQPDGLSCRISFVQSALGATLAETA